MTTAVLYTRVSSDEQALGFSLTDQVERLRDYCRKLSISILSEFQDDFTGKTFDRPGFNKLIAFVKKTKVDQILFIKWARFGRNTTDSYVMIDKFQKMGIQVQAIDEPVDFTIPQSRLMLAFYIANPHVENLIRRELSMSGTRRANMEGRYTGAAPSGYKNQRDAHKKPIIVIDPVKAPFVQKAFELMATGHYSQHEVRMQLAKEGYRPSRSKFFNLLHNQIYIGNIVVPAYKKEPEKIIKGIHAPIISESTFYKVQDILNGNRRKAPRKHKKVNPDLPLRGFLYCNTFEHKMTGSCSCGHGGKYHYYHCPNETHCERHQAQVVEQAFVRLLSKKCVSQRTCEHIIHTLEYLMKPNPEDNKAMQNKISAQEKSIELLLDRFVQGHISVDDYNRTRARYEGTLAEMKSQLELLSSQEEELASDLAECMAVMPDISQLYLKTEPELKPSLLSSMLPHKLYFDGKECRTFSFSPFIEMLSNGGAVFTAIKKMRTSEESPLVLSGSGGRT